MIGGKISVKGMCIFEHDGKVLLTKGYDKVKDQHHYRVPGGHIEFGETAEQGLRREIQEELKSDIENLVFQDIIENIFEYEGEQGHEVIFMYTGKLKDESLYDKQIIPYLESDDSQHEAEWVKIEDITNESIRVYPSFNYVGILTD